MGSLNEHLLLLENTKQSGKFIVRVKLENKFVNLNRATGIVVSEISDKQL